MTTNISINTGQRKILERFKAGVRLMLDSGTGRYAFFQGNVVMPCGPAWYRSTVNTTLTSGLIFECTQKECPDPVAMNRRIRDALVG